METALARQFGKAFSQIHTFIHNRGVYSRELGMLSLAEERDLSDGRARFVKALPCPWPEGTISMTSNPLMQFGQCSR
jgi:hypothetical protein